MLQPCRVRCALWRAKLHPHSYSAPQWATLQFLKCRNAGRSGSRSAQYRKFKKCRCRDQTGTGIRWGRQLDCRTVRHPVSPVPEIKKMPMPGSVRYRNKVREAREAASTAVLAEGGGQGKKEEPISKTKKAWSTVHIPWHRSLWEIVKPIKDMASYIVSVSDTCLVKKSSVLHISFAETLYIFY